VLDKLAEQANNITDPTQGKIENKSNIIVNMVNITDVIDSANMNIASSCIVLIGLEPFAFKNLSLEGLKRDIKITKDYKGNIFINKKKVTFIDLGEGIKVSIILSEEES
jgi:hypothetical protein